MYSLIKSYIDKIKKEDVADFAHKQGIDINDEEANVIFETIKNDWEEILYRDSEGVFLSVRAKLRPETYKVAVDLFNKYKGMIS